jgi:hypothetical protein
MDDQKALWRETKILGVKCVFFRRKKIQLCTKQAVRWFIVPQYLDLKSTELLHWNINLGDWLLSQPWLKDLMSTPQLYRVM